MENKVKPLLFLLLVAVGGYAQLPANQKYIVVGNSIGAVDTVWKTFIATLDDDSSSYGNISTSGKSWPYFDVAVSSSDSSHVIDYYLASKNMAIFEIGLNSVWDDTVLTTPLQYLTPQEDIEYLNKFYDIVKARGKHIIVGEITPAWPTSKTTDTTILNRVLNTIKERNILRKKWAAYHEEYFAETFEYLAGENGRPNAALYGADLVHPNYAGSVVLGQRYAAATIPTVTNTYTPVSASITLSIDSYTSDSNRLQLIDLSVLPDNVWDNLKPDGSNFSIYVNGTKKKRVLENFCPYAQTGTVLFSSEKINTCIVRAHIDTNETNDSTLYVDAKILRRYPFDEKPSGVSSFIEKRGGKNTTMAGALSGTPYFPQSPVIPEKINSAMYLKGSANSVIYSNLQPELSGKSKFTISWWMYVPVGSAIWSNTGYMFCAGNSNTLMFRTAFASGNFGIYASNGATKYAQVPITTLRTVAKDTTWNKFDIIVDLSLANDQKIKLVVNGQQLELTATADLPTVLPTFSTAHPFCLTGYYNITGAIPNIALDELQIVDAAITVNEAIAAYQMQTTTPTTIEGPSITVQPVSDTVQAGTNAEFTITATGDNLLYAWYKQGVFTGVTTAGYSFTTSTANDNDSIQCVVYNSVDTVSSSVVRVRVFGIDSTGIASFTIYHTGDVDSVWIDSVKATLSDAATDSVIVTPVTPLMVRRDPYTLQLFSGGVGYPYVYKMVKGNILQPSGSFANKSYINSPFK